MGRELLALQQQLFVQWQRQHCFFACSAMGEQA
jgi:hypothetical protein